MPKNRLSAGQTRRPADIVPRTATGKGSRREPRLVIEAGAPDPAALSAAIREWIVPLLVREYLAERAAKVACVTTMNVQKIDTGSLGKEQRANPATNQ